MSDRTTDDPTDAPPTNQPADRRTLKCPGCWAIITTDAETVDRNGFGRCPECEAVFELVDALGSVDRGDGILTDGGRDLDPTDPPAGWPVQLASYWSGLVDLGAVADGEPDDVRAVGVSSSGFADADTGSTSDRSNASRNLKKLADDGKIPVRRRQAGNPFYYWVDTAALGDSGTDETPDATADIPDATADAPPAEPVDGAAIPRQNETPDPADETPENVPEYVDPDHLLTSLRALTTPTARQKGDSPTSVRLVGHTGAGKTHAVRYVAEQEGAALKTLQCDEGTDRTDILGESVPVGGSWKWRDGVVTEAFRMTDDGLTFLIVDEFNRMRPEAASALMSALGRGEIHLSERNETVTADTDNLVIVATQNPPTADYEVQSTDFAQTRRWEGTETVSYLGRSHFDRGAEVARRESPDVTAKFAELVVDTANELRAYADADADTTDIGGSAGVTPSRDVKRPVPTGTVKAAVDRADMLAAVDHPDAGLKAVEQTLLDTIYGESDAHDWVAQRLTDRFSGVDPHTFGGSGDGETHTPHRDGDAGPDAGGAA
jgi:MoxR-like ATPase